MAVHLIVGESYQQINEELAIIVFPEAQDITFDMFKNNIYEVIEEAATFSLFSDQKNIFVRSSELFFNKAQDEEIALLKKYLANPNELANLIFIANKNLQLTKNELVNLIKKEHHYINLKNYDVNQIFGKVQIKCKQINISLDRHAIYYLINNSGNDYDLVCSELNKIELYYLNQDNRKPQFDDIKNILFNNQELNIYRFIDDLTNKYLSSAIERLNNLELNNIDITYIINTMVKNYRNLYNIKVFREQKDIESAKKLLKLADWQFSKLLDASYRYDNQELLEIIIKLGNLDWQFKTGKIDGYLGLEFIILEI